MNMIAPQNALQGSFVPILFKPPVLQGAGNGRVLHVELEGCGIAFLNHLVATRQGHGFLAGHHGIVGYRVYRFTRRTRTRSVATQRGQGKAKKKPSHIERRKPPEFIEPAGVHRPAWTGRG